MRAYGLKGLSMYTSPLGSHRVFLTSYTRKFDDLRDTTLLRQLMDGR